MVDEILKLLRLEDVDGRIRNAQEELAAFGPEREDAVAGAASDRAEMEAAAEARDACENVHRHLETELQDADRLVEKLDAQVYEVTSKQAMEAIQKELGAAREKKSGLEDQILETLDQIEAASARVDEAGAVATDRAGEREREEAVRAARETAREAELEQLAAERATHGANVESDVLRRYEDARRKAWPVLARVEIKSCPVCRIVIPPQKWNEIGTAKKLVTCGSCHRILYGDKVAAATP